MNIVKQNYSNRIAQNSCKVVNLFLILLLIFAINCKGVPLRKEIPKYNYSPHLITKEFLPASPKWLPAIIIYEPVLLKESALIRLENKCEKGLIPYLNKEGYTVYLVSSIDENIDFKQSAKEIDLILNQIADKHKNRSVILAGVSLGGQAVLEYMTLPTNLNNYSLVKKIFFIGTGVDYNYTNSFAEKSEKFGYENKSISELCKDKNKDNFCAKYIQYNNQLQEIDSSYKIKYFNRIPKIEKDYLTRFNKTKLQLPYLFIYGKIDSISPEESIYPLFHKIRPAAKGDNTNTLYEASEANGHTMDYDQGDLFLFEKADKEIYSKLVEWLKE